MAPMDDLISMKPSQDLFGDFEEAPKVAPQNLDNIMNLYNPAPA